MTFDCFRRGHAMRILNPVISASLLAGDKWKLTVQYDAKFSDDELRQSGKFRDGFVVWEEDDTSGDDQITGVVAISVFDPKKNIEHRVLEHTVSADALDTEFLEGEEIYAV